MTPTDGHLPGRFGFCCFAFTPYDSLPSFKFDYPIDANGEIRTLEKAQTLQLEKVEDGRHFLSMAPTKECVDFLKKRGAA